ncbi:MAG: pyrroline-5-carboxylate reductase [Sedimentisphaerales bacterium]|nr:pyrroline-5-carboxylate reductase [Sedimentisphaerales bacterium]
MDTIGFVGGGNMAEAVIRGIITAKIYNPKHIFVSDIRPDRLEFLREDYKIVTLEKNAELADEAAIIVLSIKPQNMTDVLREIKDAVNREKLIISIAAGIRLGSIAAVLGEVPIVRVMPNTPALIGEGAAALYANEKARPMLDKARSIFESVGLAVVVDNEDLIDAVTAVSGSGPAYYFLLMEEMIAAAATLGLDRELAKDLVLQTAKGASLLAVEADKNNESPSVLRRKVTSPGGTTEAALNVFAANKFGSMIADALKAAVERSRALRG